MAKNGILLLATVLLAVQLMLVSCESSEELEDTPRNRLLAYTMQEYSKVAKYTVDANKKLFRAVIREGSRRRNRQLQTHLSKLSEFVEKAKKLEDTPDDTDTLFDLFGEVADLHSEFDDNEIENPSEDIVLMDQLLSKHGSADVAFDTLRHFLNFLYRFNTKLDEYMSTLTAEQKRNDPKFSNWYQSFKNEKDMQNRIQLFGKFFDLYGQ